MVLIRLNSRKGFGDKKNRLVYADWDMDIKQIRLRSKHLFNGTNIFEI